MSKKEKKKHVNRIEITESNYHLTKNFFIYSMCIIITMIISLLVLIMFIQTFVAFDMNRKCNRKIENFSFIYGILNNLLIYYLFSYNYKRIMDKILYLRYKQIDLRRCWGRRGRERERENSLWIFHIQSFSRCDANERLCK